MKKLKRTLALALVVCMLCSFLPVGALAAEASAPTTNLSTTGSPFQRGTGDSNSFRIPALVTLSDGTLVAAADARWNTTYDGGGLDTMVAISKDGGETWNHSFANYLGDNGNVYNGSSSSCFIDPALVVTTTDNNDGRAVDTIYMLCDLYPYGVALNGSGNIAPSTDSGFNTDGYLMLDYNSAGTFGYYLKDGKIYANGSTDPLNGYTVDDHFNLTSDYGNDTNLFFADSPFKVARTGYLYLTTSTDGGESWSAPQLLNLKRSGEQVCLVGPGRGTVVYRDDVPTIVFPVYTYHYGTQRVSFIYSTDGVSWQRSEDLSYNWGSESVAVDLFNNTMRVFFRNGTGYLMYADYSWNTNRWGDPRSTGIATNSNTQISAISLTQTIDGEQVILVSCPAGPNGGSTSSAGSQRLNGKIFLFTVNEDTKAMTKRGEVALNSKHSATNYFMYSCLSALIDENGNENGEIAILYEDNENNHGTSNTSYYEMSFDIVNLTDFGVTPDGSGDTDVDVDVNPGEPYEKEVTLKVGETFTETVPNIYVKSGSTTTAVADVSWVGTEASSSYATAITGTNASFTGNTINTIDVADCLYTFTASGDGFVVQSKSNPNLYLNTTRNAAGCPNANVSNTVIVTTGNIENTFFLKCPPQTGDNTTSNGYLYFWRDGKNRFDRNSVTSGAETQCSFYLYRPAAADEQSSTEIPGYVRVTDAYNEIAAGEYLIAHEYSNVYYLLHPSTTTSGNDAGRYPHVAKVTGQTAGIDADASTAVTITGTASGQHTVQVGGAITYNVTVNAVQNVELKVGESKTYTDNTGNYEDNITKRPATAIATMAVDGTTVAGTKKLVEITSLDQIVSGKSYLITSRNGNHVLTDESYSNSSLKIGGVYSENSTELWTFTGTYSGSNGSYTIAQNGKFLNLSSSNGARMLENAQELTIYRATFDGYTHWIISGGQNAALNNNAQSNTYAGVWSPDGGGLWRIWEIVETPGSASTEITFTGVTAGTTTATVGFTQYDITVSSVDVEVNETVDVELMVGESKTYDDTTGAYTSAIINPDASIVNMELNSVTTNSEPTVSTTKATVLEGGSTYIIRVTGTNYALTSNKGRTTWTPSDGDTRAYEAFTGAEADNMWTLEASGNGYKLKCATGYLNLGKNAAWITATGGDIFTITNDNGVWVISDGTYNIDTLGGLTSYYCAGGWPDSGTRFDLYKVNISTSDSTEITFKGVAPGFTTAVVGTTQYNISVYREVDIHVGIGKTETYTDTSGAYADQIKVYPEQYIADMDVANVNRLVPVSTIESGKQYLIVNTKTRQVLTNNAVGQGGDYGSRNGLETTGTASADSTELWTITASGDRYTVVQDNRYLLLSGYVSYTGDTKTELILQHTDNGWTIADDRSYASFQGHTAATYYLSDNVGENYGGTALGTSDANNEYMYWTIYEIVPQQTEVTFTGVGEGTTTATVGYTKYNITVDNITDIVDVLLYVYPDGSTPDSVTFVDSTGNYVGFADNKVPNGNVVDMTLANQDVTVYPSVVTTPVTSLDALEDGAKYIIRVAGTTSALSTNVGSNFWGTQTRALEANTLVPNEDHLWILQKVNDKYRLVALDGNVLCMGEWENQAKLDDTFYDDLTLEYSELGWIFTNQHGRSLTVLSDSCVGGTSNSSSHFDIFKVNEETVTGTVITFTGVAEGTTTAVVGTTRYNITVKTAADTVSSTDGGWKVDTALQQKRYKSMLNVEKDLYTDESWQAYELARAAAARVLERVAKTTYTTQANAQAALEDVIAAVNALERAYNDLTLSRTLNIFYRLEGTDTIIKRENIKAPADAATLTLESTFVVDNILYKVKNNPITLDPNKSTMYVDVEKLAQLGDGFVGTDVYSASGSTCDVNGRPIKELTLTPGVTIDLALKTALTNGQTVEWISEDESVATVANGSITTVGVGNTYVTATVYNSDGSVFAVNRIPVNVLPKNYEDGDATRLVAIFVDQVDNTTVWCMINGARADGQFAPDGNPYLFEVSDGELIYGNFKRGPGAMTQDIDSYDPSFTTALTFFGDPDEAHALVHMSSTNSAGDYYQIHDAEGARGEGGDYYVSNATSGAGYWQALGLAYPEANRTADWDVVRDMVDWAIAHGCDGAQGFTRRDQQPNILSNLSFISDPMPTIEKQVDGVLPTTRKMADYRRYAENMVASVKELVYFKITVTLKAPTVWRTYKAGEDQYSVTENGITYAADANGNKYSAILYKNSVISDTVLPGAYLYTKELDQADGKYDGEISPDKREQEDRELIKEFVDAAWTPEELAAGKRVIEYYLMYEIQEEDIPRFYIDNIATLSFQYESHYSKGLQNGIADAEARISVVGTSMDNVVIDFGQSFTYDAHDYNNGKITYTFEGLDNTHLKGAYVEGRNDIPGVTKSKATAKYGDVKVYREPTGEYDGNGYPLYTYTVEYTPHSILQETDSVLIYGYGDTGNEKLINSFLVYPASTVYYEEGFLDNTKGWNVGNPTKATMEQEFELLGVSQYNDLNALSGYITNKKHNYGYDPIYDEDGTDGHVVKSSMTSTTAGDSTEFTFTGTGFEIFADCTEESGYVNVTVKNADGEIEKIFMVNTVVKAGPGENNGATAGQKGNMNALPIVSMKNLDHGTYTVTLTKVLADNPTEDNPKGSKPVTIDGVRITNTLEKSEAFTIDNEESPAFYQLRDYVLSAIGIKANSSKDYGDLTGMAQQVYNAMISAPNIDSNAPTAIITDTNTLYGDSSTLQDLLDNGPKNEVYLWKGQTLTFRLYTARLMQVGMKAPSGETNYTITVAPEYESTITKTGSIASTVDMFYTLNNDPAAPQEYLVSITNNGDKALAITDLKLAYDPSATVQPVTLEDVTFILRAAGYYTSSTEPETPDEPLPFLDVPEDSFYYDSVAWALKNQVTTGLSASHFGPDVNCNRAQAITFLWRALGSPEPTISDNPFVDVEPGSFYEKAVLWAVEKGITTGTDATHFNPMTNCSRATVVTFLYRTFESPDVSSIVNPFSDVPADAWYTAPILWAVEQGITTGIGNGYFGVDNVCNRAQIVTFLYRALN